VFILYYKELFYFIAVTECVYCEIRPETLKKIHVVFRLQMFNYVVRKLIIFINNGNNYE